MAQRAFNGIVFESEDGSRWRVVHRRLWSDHYTCVRLRWLPLLNGPVRVFPGSYVAWRKGMTPRYGR